MFKLEDEIKVLEREIRIRSEKLFIDGISLKSLKEELKSNLSRKKKNKEFGISMDKSRAGMNAAMAKIKEDQDNNS